MSGLTVLGRAKNSKVQILEKNAKCVVISGNKMQDTNISDVSITDGMVRNTIKSDKMGFEIVCIHYENPKTVYENKFATLVMGYKVMGHAILFSTDQSFCAEKILEFASESNKKPLSWADMAKNMPKFVPLDENSKNAKIMEMLNKDEKKPKPTQNEQVITESDWFEDVYTRRQFSDFEYDEEV
jgi:hypothetical protein